MMELDGETCPQSLLILYTARDGKLGKELGDEAEIVMYKGKGGSGRHCYLPTTTNPCLRLLGDGVWVRDWIREGKKKMKRR